MPELPEVETVRRTLQTLVVGKTIERVAVGLRRIIQQPEPESFCDALVGQTIRGIGRRGKFLRFELDELVLVSHLRMEGRYGVYNAGEPVEPHTHVIFHLDGEAELRYRDVRQFGTMHLFAKGRDLQEKPLNKLGIEPLDAQFTAQLFAQLLGPGKRTTKIKPFLLNQAFVAGLGNIYVDEALFRAGIHPEHIAGELGEEQANRLHATIVEVLSEAVSAGGSSIKSYVNGQGEMGMFQQQLYVYGRANEPCVRCGAPLLKKVVGGRGTHYCQSCQPG